MRAYLHKSFSSYEAKFKQIYDYKIYMRNIPEYLLVSGIYEEHFQIRVGALVADSSTRHVKCSESISCVKK